MDPAAKQSLDRILLVAILLAGAVLAWLLIARPGGPPAAVSSPAPAPILIDATTSDALAAEHFRTGLIALHQRTPASLQRALHEFEQALARDPDYARAWAGQAMALFLLPAYTGHNRTDAHSRSLKAAREAVRLAPGDAMAQTALGAALGATSVAGPAATEALAAYELALSIDPGYATAHHWKGVALAESGDLSGGEAALRAALAIEPGLHPARSHLGLVLSMQGRWADALAECARVQRDAPQLRTNLAQAFIAAAMLGRASEQLQALRAFFQADGGDASLADRLLAAIDQPDNAPMVARELLAQLEAGGPRGPLISLLALLGAQESIAGWFAAQGVAQAFERYQAGPYGQMNQKLAARVRTAPAG